MFFNFLIILFLLSSDIKAQWYPQNSGTSQPLNEVMFIDVNHGLVVGFHTILKTTNGGVDWINISLSGLNTHGVWVFDSLKAVVTGYYNPTGTAQIMQTTNGGITWNYLFSTIMTFFYNVSFKNSNGIVIGSQIVITSDGGINWLPVTNFPTFDLMYGVTYTESDYIVVVGQSGNIFISFDGGTNWLPSVSSTINDLIDVAFINDYIGFVVGENGAILKTTDLGFSWTTQNSRTTNDLFDVSFVDENNGFVVGDSGIILRTTDGGLNWMRQESGTLNALGGVSMIDLSICTVVGTNGTILRTTNGGILVELVSFNATIEDENVNLKWITATEINNRGFEIERASMNSQYEIQNPQFEKIGFVDGKGTTTEAHSYSFVDDLFGVSSLKLYYRLKQIDFDGSFEYSDIVEVNIAPTEFSLSQNYPNPFNPATSIKFQIAEFGFVSLKVYDVLGREIAILVNEEKQPGSYEVEFSTKGGSAYGGDASNLSSGIYFYQLKAGNFIETKNMIFIK